MEKTVIIINGKGGVGKDTLCDFAATAFRTRNISSITPIKKIALENGWDGGKDARSRKFLSDLKKLFTEYNDLPTNYLYRCYEEFMESDEELMFAHIREATEIEKLKNRIPTRCVTLLVERRMEHSSWGNASDDEVGNYPYDLVYANDLSLLEAKEDFLIFLKKNLD